ncbi:MAG: methyltransferase domain-containing protein [Candidatus Shapirobacteria bacterium]|jgi:ubiquinone/menaquinone biosynthesis C-methylase UbiE
MNVLFLDQFKKKYFNLILKYPFIVNYIANKQSQNYWINQKNWRVKDIFYKRAIKQEQFLKKNFIPLLNKNSIICDLACACGDFAFIVAPFVKKIEGFDLSSKMVKLANKTARDKKINNTHFYEANINNYFFKRKYDHFMCLGLFTYIFNNKDANNIIKKISDSIKINGYLVIKDTLTTEKNNIIHLVFNDPYSANYRSKKEYLKLFKEKNFSFIKETKLSKGNDDRFFSYCAIFQKTK